MSDRTWDCCSFSRVESLQRDLDQVREKEREETSTLEDIVHHIESNLETSTVSKAYVQF